MASEVEEFFMRILEEEGPDDMLCQQNGAPPLFSKEVTDSLIKSFQRNGLSGAGLSLGHLVHLTLLPVIFSFGGISRMLCTCHHWLPFCRNLL
jgi:hypothetical protein